MTKPARVMTRSATALAHYYCPAMVDDSTPPSPGLLPAAIRALAARLRGSLGASSPLADSLSKGELREDEVINAFRPHIAKRYDLARGIVVNSSGQQSDPQDLVIHDSTAIPALFGDGPNRIFPVESVVGVIQIKSRATKATIAQAVKNVASAKRLLPAEMRYGLPHGGTSQPGTWGTAASFFAGALFLSSSTPISKLLDAFADVNFSVEPRQRCDAMSVVNKASAVWGDPQRGSGMHFTFRAEDAAAPMSFEAGDDSLLFFYLSLVEHLRNWISPPINWLDYVFGPDGSRHPLNFSWGYWYEEEDNPPD